MLAKLGWFWGLNAQKWLDRERGVPVTAQKHSEDRGYVFLRVFKPSPSRNQAFS